MKVITIIVSTCLALACAQSYQEPPKQPPKGVSIEPLLESINEELLMATQTKAALSALDTSDQLALDLILRLKDDFFGVIPVVNKQQDELIATFESEVETLAGLVDASLVEAIETLGNARFVNKNFEELLKEMQSNINMDQEQAKQIAELRAKVDQTKKDILAALAKAIFDLENRIAEASSEFQDLADAIDSRKCEYGSFVSQPGKNQVNFKTDFSETPSVSLVYNGASFKAMVGKGEDPYAKKPAPKAGATLAVDNYVTNVDRDGFEFVSTGVFDDSDLNFATISYMACKIFD